MNKSFIVVDCLAGDFGKGTTVDFLTRKYNSNLTIKFSGGSQCAHHCEDENGNHHMFSQFGAGSFSGARTLLGKNVLINPLTFLEEEKKLSRLIDNPFDKVFIDENAVIISPYHQAVNKLIESNRGNSKHGSCAQGIWQTRLDSINNPAECIRAKDLNNYKALHDKLLSAYVRMHQVLKDANIKLDFRDIYCKPFFDNRENLVEVYRNFAKKVKIIDFDNVNWLINNSVNPIFEGNQGIILDENEGFYPYTTGTSTTSKHALQMLKDCNWQGEKEVIGGLRTFATRHGVGPLPTESTELSNILNDKYNLTNPWQDNFRFGWLDLNLLRYSLQVDGNINSLSVTHIDELKKLDKWKVCHYYEDTEGKKWTLNKLNNPAIEDMEIITKKLLNSRPIYEEYDKDEVLSLVEWELERKIKVKSFGAKCNEKELVF